MEEITTRKTIRDLLEGYSKDRSSIIPILQDINREYNYIPKDSILDIASYLDLPKTEIYRVATFYKALSLTPKGRTQIKVCMGTACHVRGAEPVLSELERELKIKKGQTTRDLNYSIETVNCVGACAMAPVVMINQEYFGECNPSTIRKIIDKK